jgi:hypothetical protein
LWTRFRWTGWWGWGIGRADWRRKWSFHGWGFFIFWWIRTLSFTPVWKWWWWNKWKWFILVIFFKPTQFLQVDILKNDFEFS